MAEDCNFFCGLVWEGEDSFDADSVAVGEGEFLFHFYFNASIFSASEKSFSDKLLLEWVKISTSTLFCEIVIVGWWFSFSASWAILFANAIVCLKSGKS